MSELIESVMRVLADGPPLRLAVLFGSHAKQRARPTSDVDIAILPCDAVLPLRAELNLATRISVAVGREVDIVRIDHASLVLRREIARDGVMVLAEPAWEWVQFRVRTATEYADMADALREGARWYHRRVLSGAR